MNLEGQDNSTQENLTANPESSDDAKRDDPVAARNIFEEVATDNSKVNQVLAGVSLPEATFTAESFTKIFAPGTIVTAPPQGNFEVKSLRTSNNGHVFINFNVGGKELEMQADTLVHLLRIGTISTSSEDLAPYENHIKQLSMQKAPSFVHLQPFMEELENLPLEDKLNSLTDKCKNTFSPEQASTIEELLQKLLKLRREGLKEPLEDLLDFDMHYARADGTPIRTPLERLNYLNKLENLSTIDIQWYKDKPPTPNDEDSKAPHGSYQYVKYKDAYYSIKDYTAEFVSTHLIPELLEQKETDFEEIIKQIHKWQIRGSEPQRDFVTGRLRKETEGIDISEEYRNGNVVVGITKDGSKSFNAPAPQDIDKLIRLFCAKLNSMQEEINLSSETDPEEELTDKVLSFAAYAQQRLIDIHPMFDGNGRTSRLLYSYIISSNLGPNSIYKNIPMENGENGEPTMHSKLSDINHRHTSAKYKNMNATEVSQSVTNTIENDNIIGIMNDREIGEYVEFVKNYNSNVKSLPSQNNSPPEETYKAT